MNCFRGQPSSSSNKTPSVFHFQSRRPQTQPQTVVSARPLMNETKPAGGGKPPAQKPERLELPPLSQWSSPPFPDSHYAAPNFMLGAGMVIIQPSSGKVVVIHLKEDNVDYWFLPKGRKDVGESLQEAALREAYEESGLRVEFMPLYSNQRQPRPPDQPRTFLNSEAIYVTSQFWSERRRTDSYGGEYFTFWYVGQIPEDAAIEANTRMPDEEDYVTHSATFEEAMDLLPEPQRMVVQYGYGLWKDTLQFQSIYGPDLAGMAAPTQSVAGQASNLINATTSTGSGEANETSVEPPQTELEAVNVSSSSAREAEGTSGVA